MRYYLCPDKDDSNKNAWTPDIAAAHMFRTQEEANAIQSAGTADGATGVQEGHETWYVVKDEPE
jgi:hypothetical protein